MSANEQLPKLSRPAEQADSTDERDAKKRKAAQAPCINVGPQDEHTCRFCFEADGELLAPCGCQGSVQYVHFDCLKKWALQRLSIDLLNGSAEVTWDRCGICTQRYIPDTQIRLIDSLTVTIQELFGVGLEQWDQHSQSHKHAKEFLLRAVNGNSLTMGFLQEIVSLLIEGCKYQLDHMPHQPIPQPSAGTEAAPPPSTSADAALQLPGSTNARGQPVSDADADALVQPNAIVEAIPQPANTVDARSTPVTAAGTSVQPHDMSEAILEAAPVVDASPLPNSSPDTRPSEAAELSLERGDVGPDAIPQPSSRAADPIQQKSEQVCRCMLHLMAVLHHIQSVREARHQKLLHVRDLFEQVSARLTATKTLLYERLSPYKQIINGSAQLRSALQQGLEVVDQRAAEIQSATESFCSRRQDGMIGPGENTVSPAGTDPNVLRDMLLVLEKREQIEKHIAEHKRLASRLDEEMQQMDVFEEQVRTLTENALSLLGSTYDTLTQAAAANRVAAVSLDLAQPDSDATQAACDLAHNVEHLAQQTNEAALEVSAAVQKAIECAKRRDALMQEAVASAQLLATSTLECLTITQNAATAMRRSVIEANSNVGASGAT